MRARVCVCRLAALFFVFGAGRCDLRRAFSSHGTSAGPRLCWSVQCRAERPFWQDIECAWRFLPTGTASRGAPMCIMSQPSRVRVPFASGFRVPHRRARRPNANQAQHTSQPRYIDPIMRDMFPSRAHQSPSFYLQTPPDTRQQPTPSPTYSQRSPPAGTV